jgi:hypothetical protein
VSDEHDPVLHTLRARLGRFAATGKARVTPPEAADARRGALATFVRITAN